ncbi:MAG: sodium ion-translocating decarboxylase subunit beta, partial [Clostridia bacterium]|nr:sodium ion-translocating decarboxylase subunit beta [Clostridia bacterium]
TIKMPYAPTEVKRITKILFPIIVTIIAGLVAPDSVSLVGMLMFGNLLRECGVLDNLSDTAQSVLTNIITLLLGITIAASMKAENFVTWQTLVIMALGLFAFTFDTIGGVFFAKFVNLFLPAGKKINPMVGAAGISAFPMASRVVQKLGIEADPNNHLLMHAVSANVSGQIASVVAGGVILSIVPSIIAGM